MGAAKPRKQQPSLCKNNMQVVEGKKNADWNSWPMTGLYPRSTSGAVRLILWKLMKEIFNGSCWKNCAINSIGYRVLFQENLKEYYFQESSESHVLS